MSSPRLPILSVLWLFGLAACDPALWALPEPELVYEECEPMRGPAPDCDTAPELCAPLTEHAVVVSTHTAEVLDLVFVPEGFTDDEIPVYREHVAQLIADLQADRAGIVGRAPNLFNLHVVIEASASSELANAERSDTLLGGCYRSDSLGGTEPFITVSPPRLDLLARQTKVDVDVAVVVANTSRGRANAWLPDTGYSQVFEPGVAPQREAHATLPAAMLNLGSDAAVLDHELGHALIGLGDEYSDVGGCYGHDEQPMFTTAADDLVEVPNLTRDAEGAKWHALVQGALPGGRRHASCVYHPTDSCRMLASHSERYCPVCERAIEQTLGSWRGVNDGPPRCVLEASSAPLAMTFGDWIALRTLDRDLPARSRLWVDGELVLETSSEHAQDFSGSVTPDTSTWSDRSIHVRGECVDAQGLRSEVVQDFQAIP
ncbi:MAG: M64 family metallopeptidase [Pseudomonadota bacterium]